MPSGAKRKWVVAEDVALSEFEMENLEYRSFLKEGGETRISGDKMRQRASAMKGNLGLADAKRFLADAVKIPQNLRGFCIVFPGTVLRDPYGYLYVACLFGGDDRDLNPA